MMQKVTFASCYVYAPTGADVASERSRLLRSLLKAGDPRFMLRYAIRVREQMSDGSPIAGYLNAGQVLIPVPGSAPSAAGAATVAERLAVALIEAGLGGRVWCGLHRVCAVRKSATSARGSRPSVGHHFASFAIEPAGGLPREVVLIDDVVTKGRTLLAAAARVREACPAAEIRAFALLRTLGFAQKVEQLIDPCVGEIRWRAGDARRNP